MKGKYRIGLAGLAHNHVWHILELIKASELGELAAAAVENPSNDPLLKERQDKLRNEFGVSKIYCDYRDMIKNEKLDVILTYTENNRHAEVVEAAAAAGLDVMVEKPMGARLEDAERMVAAAEKHNVKLMINWPIAWSPVYRKIYSLVQEGAIGQVARIRRVSGHSGPQPESMDTFYDWRWMTDKEKNGAGAYMDFCCYGAALCRWLLGMPNEVYGTAGNYTKKDFLNIDDNGTLIMCYDNAVGISEGTWSLIGRPSGGFVVSGSEGTIEVVSDNGQEKIKLFTKEDRAGKIIEAPALPEGEGGPVEYFLNCIKNNRKIEGICSPKISRDAQELLEAGLISAEKKKVVALPLKI